MEITILVGAVALIIYAVFQAVNRTVKFNESCEKEFGVMPITASRVAIASAPAVIVAVAFFYDGQLGFSENVIAGFFLSFGILWCMYRYLLVRTSKKIAIQSSIVLAIYGLFFLVLLGVFFFMLMTSREESESSKRGWY